MRAPSTRLRPGEQRHGIIPCPAPATLALLEGAAVAETDLTGETVTPTGAALLRAADARYGSPPPMTLRATGYGAGTRRLPDRPNVVAVSLGEPIAAERPHRFAPSSGHRESVLVLETNVDDVTGETLAHTIAEALAAGARDAWTAPAVMKKGRPAHVLHVLTEPEHAERLEQLMLTQTGALGIRHVPATRTVLPRCTETVELDACVIRIKIGPHGAKPEHDDVAAAARRLGLPLRTLAQRALDRHARRRPVPIADEEEATDGHTEQ